MKNAKLSTDRPEQWGEADDAPPSRHGRGGKTAVETQGGNANTSSAAKQHFLKHCSSSWTKRGSILRTLLLTAPRSRFSISFFFFFVLTCFLSKHALPLSPEQYFTLVSRSAAKELLVVQRSAYLFRITSPPNASLLLQSTRLKSSHKPSSPPNRSNAVLNFNFKCNIFYLYFILILFLVCFSYDFLWEKQLELCINFVRWKNCITKAKVELQCKLWRTYSLIN